METPLKCPKIPVSAHFINTHAGLFTGLFLPFSKAILLHRKCTQTSVFLNRVSSSVHPTELSETSGSTGHIEPMCTWVQLNVPGQSNNTEHVHLMDFRVYGSE